MTTAFVRGLQGDDPRYWRVASLLKHFVANSNEDERAHSSSDFDDRLFHEYYAAGFRAAIVDGGARAYMAAYNAHDGTPCTTHPMLEQVTVRLLGTGRHQVHRRRRADAAGDGAQGVSRSGARRRRVGEGGHQPVSWTSTAIPSTTRSRRVC